MKDIFYKTDKKTGQTSIIKTIDHPDPPAPTKAEAKADVQALTDRLVSLGTWTPQEAASVLAATPQ